MSVASARCEAGRSLQRAAAGRSGGPAGELRLCHLRAAGTAGEPTRSAQQTQPNQTQPPQRTWPGDTSQGLAPSAVCTVLRRPRATLPCTRAPSCLLW